jgi:hypothetical protein
MKFIAVLAGVACVFAGTSLSSLASSAHSPTRAATVPHGFTSIVLPAIGPLSARRVYLPLQTSTTPGATDTPVPAVTPTATPNPAFPDPVTLLQNSFTLYGQLNTVHFENITDGNQQSSITLHIDAVGDASCKGPSLKAKVTSKEAITGTAQSKSTNFNLIQVKNAYYKKAKSTKNKWQKVKASQATAFTFTIDNPLACPDETASSGTGSDSGSPSSAIKNLTNLGPETVNGVSVWHVQATEVDVDATTGATTQALLDYYIGQQHPFPYKYTATVNDTQNGIKLVFTQLLTKFGEKLTIKAPKVGSTTP